MSEERDQHMHSNEVDGVTNDSPLASPTLMIDTSYGLTVAVVGNEPHHIADSRAHVEKLTVTIEDALSQAHISAQDVKTVVAASGPGPFTGLRAGIVAARAFAFATGARLLGHDVLRVQAVWEQAHPHAHVTRLVLALNDARRKQLYWQLWRLSADGEMTPLTQMDISYPQTIAERISAVEKSEQARGEKNPLPLVIIGPGTSKYKSEWDHLAISGIPVIARIDDSVLCADGAEGPRLFAQCALDAAARGENSSTEPLYLRRPDAQIPPTPKPVAEKATRASNSGDAGIPAGQRAQAPQSVQQASKESHDLKWSSWSKADLRRFATKTDPNVDDEDQPDELTTFGSDADSEKPAAAQSKGAQSESARSESAW